MDSDHEFPPMFRARESDENGGPKISVSGGLNSLQHLVVDIEPFSHLSVDETDANSRTDRHLSGRSGGKRISPTSPSAIICEGSVPEIPMVAAIPHVHHQITVKNDSLSESKCRGKRSRFRRSSSTLLFVNPRRILILFATLSCLGTMLLIYFTLSVGKLNTDDMDLN
ncbi:uncharacterized protein LOC127254984 isoform X2 [Andrographis paniculata]|uniref:uncharacterized protein LOC127254984 isoform X2 n=1 Tax=Andrographis paniculata TaxID=175694 RepID=UPI0021E8EB45|nr:uncharacterized protein LOC127254984 isoform X2 [Andrographis paniculata]